MHELVRIAPDRPEPWIGNALVTTLEAAVLMKWTIVVALDYSTDTKANPKKALEHLGRVCFHHLHCGSVSKPLF